MARSLCRFSSESVARMREIRSSYDPARNPPPPHSWGGFKLGM
ncbi:hypothetical protein PITC_090630 [Penicillium italicum]|uniref:Uncharacterized protein n=1 Tax=Penicillium italicum TaxID=40296 RepID=A0A0A2L9V0_PENIT|nr:hypothetical protein PITC_090630 [Penicillium italicum]